MFGENLQMKIVCSDEVAEKILKYIADNYFDTYAIIAWLDDVEVLRGDHYLKNAT